MQLAGGIKFAYPMTISEAFRHEWRDILKCKERYLYG